ncbi:MAG: bidirectional hydrogenase complex protein HoxE [Xenococcaceae cyanobacterium]
MQATTTETKGQKSQGAKKTNSKDDKRLKVLDTTMKRNRYRQDALIEILHKAQESFGHLEPEVLEYVARGLKLPLSRVYGVATFYHLFSLKPKGKHTCEVCVGTACHVNGASALLKILEKQANLRPGQTTPDGKVSLMTTHCIGTCGMALAAVFDDKILGKQTPESLIETVKGWLAED